MATVTRVLGSDKAIRLNDNELLGLVSGFSWSPNFNAQDIYELGNTTKLDTALELTTSGSIELASAGNTAGLLARMHVVRDGSGNFTGYEYASGAASGRNLYDFTQDDLAEMKFDLLVHEKPDQKTFSRSLALPCAYLTGFSGRADASGMASETYNFSGNFVTGFDKPFHDVRAIPATRTGNLSILLNDTAMTNYTLAYVVVDGRVITTKPKVATNPTAVDIATNTRGVSNTGVISLTTDEGYVIPAGAVISAYVYKTVGGTTFPALADAERPSANTKPVYYVKGHQINIWLVPNPASLTAVTTANISGTTSAGAQWLKVQSVDWNVDLRVEQLRQIAVNQQGSTIYAQTPNFPIDISVSLTVTETDWSDWKSLLTGKSTPGGGTGNVNDNTYDFAPASVASEFAVVVEYYAKTGEKLQVWQFRDLRLDGYGNRVNVGGRSEVSWSLRGSEFALAGRNA